ncbi:serine/threonine-protein phosphatase 4 regulatory subunit 3 isoform X2 [Malaya genurostris]|uniref:serine/threonine-protein phosphatase 4 regulatory subunit 3 isoform X2 n=1 Tax=Malaya genurostris TaxID=325434 RepID=UPI0026F3F16D|nr:serine/threonine-protein phosphatase 4 regulatory subunit 3 isoform X2 [Malaya genurostris]
MTTDTRRRVKLYALNADRQWDDRGTGHVTSSYVDRVKGVSLLVHAENDGSMLLESKIHPDTIYHKQQDTLIVWSEGDNFDLALSFQEKAGCDEIWEKICQVQGKDPSVEITQDVVEESEDERFEDMSDSAPPIELPPCELSRLEDISEAIANGLTSQIRKDKLAQTIEIENYIKKLLNLFHICEDLENHEGLHYLYEIFKNIFLLNKNALFEIMFAEDTIFDVVGCLEYDPTGNPPKQHRQYLKQLAKFREAIPIRNSDLLAKIHQTYRVQYIQDIVLPTPSLFEDNMLNTLSSFIFFNKVEIVTLIQEDEKFLDDLFTLLTDPNTTDAKRRDIILFLKEFCNFAQYLQPQSKETFYKTLISLGILPALEITLAINDKKTKAASIDILTTIVEYSPSIVRDYTLQQYNNSDTDEDQTLINIAIEQMLSDSEPELGGAVQLMGVLRILLDPENMLSSVNKSEKSDFLNFFYKHSIQTLTAPLLLNTLTDKPANEDYHTVQLLGLVLELLSFCVEHHTYHIKNCIINKDLLRRILVLMKSTHTFLVLGALRFLRKIIALKDEFYNRHIVKGNLFAPVVDAFIRNNGRYNLLESAILELFEFIKIEDIKSLYTYFVESFGKIFDDVQYVQTFKTLKNKYDQQQDRLKEKEKGGLDSVPSILRNSSRYRRDQRQVDEEEEIWFNEEEDFSDNKAGSPELDTSLGKIFDKKSPESSPTATSVNGPKFSSNSTSNSATSQQSPLAQLQTSPPLNNNNSTDINSNSSSTESSEEAASTIPQHPLAVAAAAAAAVAAVAAASVNSASSSATSSSSSTASTKGDSVTEDAPLVDSDSLLYTSGELLSDNSHEAPVATTTTITDPIEGEDSCSPTKSFETDSLQSTASDGSSSVDDCTSSSSEAIESLVSTEIEPMKRLVEDSSANVVPSEQLEDVRQNRSDDAGSSDVLENSSSVSSNSSSSNSSSNGDIEASATSLVSSATIPNAVDAAPDVTEPDTDGAVDVSAPAAAAVVNTLKKALVDYEGDSDDEDDDDSDSPVHKKARIA